MQCQFLANSSNPWVTAVSIAPQVNLTNQRIILLIKQQNRDSLPHFGRTRVATHVADPLYHGMRCVIMPDNPCLLPTSWASRKHTRNPTLFRRLYSIPLSRDNVSSINHPYTLIYRQARNLRDPVGKVKIIMCDPFGYYLIASKSRGKLAV